jgi:hypothetical protein
VFDEPSVTPVPRVDVENIEAGDLASRHADERSWITPPQLIYRIGIASGIFVPARRRRFFINMAREARQSL